MNTDIYKISNSKTIGRVLPFFARGRRMTLFLEAAASPLISLHRKFLIWAYKMMVKLKITSQTVVMEWYLGYLFKDFVEGEGCLSDSTTDENDGCLFTIEQDYEIKHLLAFYYRELAMLKILGVRIYNLSECTDGGAVGGVDVSALSKPVKDVDEPYVIIVHAPALKADVALTYSKQQYKDDIVSAVQEYLTSFVPCLVVINGDDDEEGDEEDDDDESDDNDDNNGDDN